MRVARGVLLLFVFGLACGSSGGAGRDGGGPDAGGDAPATSCPAAQPAFGATCTGTLSCAYGKASCCGIESSARTCTCQFGFFDCQQTVECNFVCPDAGND